MYGFLVIFILGKSGYGERYEDNVCIIDRNNIYNLGSCNPKHTSQLIPHFANNHLYTPNAKINARCGRESWDLEEMQEHGMEVGTVVKELVNDDVVIEWGKKLFGL